MPRMQLQPRTQRRQWQEQRMQLQPPAHHQDVAQQADGVLDHRLVR
jgi:hypothetical protein